MNYFSGQGHGRTGGYPQNTGHEAGMHPEWETSPFTHTLELPVHQQVYFWNGQETYMDTGIAHTETPHSSGSNQGHWSCEVRTLHTVPLCCPIVKMQFQKHFKCT